MRLKAARNIQPTDQSLADMRWKNGDGIRWEIERAATRLTLPLVKNLSETAAYQLLCTIIPPEKVALYFEKVVRHQIYPAVRTAYIAKWHAENDSPVSHPEVVWHCHQGLGPALQAIWPCDDIPLKLGPTRELPWPSRAALGRLRRKPGQLLRHLSRVSAPTPSSRPTTPNEPTIAVHYIHGIDPARRQDLFWFPTSFVDPGRVLVFIDNIRVANRGGPVPAAVLKQIEASGMNWLCLESGAVSSNDASGSGWSPPGRSNSLLTQFKSLTVAASGPTEHWLVQVAKRLLSEIDYWVAFYQSFNVKVHVDVAGTKELYVAQNIALDLSGGVRIGWQRSEFRMEDAGEIGEFPNHVHFTWNTRGKDEAEITRSRINSVIVSGFPFDGAWQSSAVCQQLRASVTSNGARFVVALFDNSFVWYGLVSKTGVAKFYAAFLHWVLSDPQIAVLNKSKKPEILDSLKEIRPLMIQAEATGRWLNLADVFGRLPSDASRGADMSVGIGISSAITEAAIAGGKGIHYDHSPKYSHSLYQWGYEKVVFDDLDNLMASLKRYKLDPTSEPDLGDHSHMMDEMDPFHDGHSGDRIGYYIGRLLASFDAGVDRDQAIQEANTQYAARWGPENVILPDRAVR